MPVVTWSGMPDIYLLIKGQQQGPYTETQVKEWLTEGILSSDLLAWHEGMADWVEVENLLAHAEVPQASPSVPKVVPQPFRALSPTVATEAVSKPKSQTLKHIGIGAAGLAALMILGLSIGAGVGLVHKTRANHHVTGLVGASPSAPNIVVTERPYTVPEPPSVPLPVQANQATLTGAPMSSTNLSTITQADGRIRAKVSYLQRDKEAILVRNLDSGTEIAAFGLPANFSEGDVWEGALYPAGVWIAGGQRYHAFDTTQSGAAVKLDIQASNVRLLPLTISAYKKLVAEMDKMIAVDRQTGMDSDAAQAQLKRDELQRKLDKAQQELSALQ